MRKIINGLLLCCCVLTGCTQRSGDKVAMGEVKYVKEFPHNITLSRIDDFSCDEIGLNGVRQIDSLLILSHAKVWTILSADANKSYGTCLNFGGGPNEFVFTPRCGTAAYRTEQDSLIAYVCDKNRGRLLRFNISKFIDSGKDSLEQVFQSDRMNSSIWDVIALGGDSILMQMPNDNFTGFHRNILTADSLWELAATKAAGEATVTAPEHVNILAKVTRSRPDGQKSVEAMTSLNQINLFSTDGSQAMTICVGDELDDVGSIESSWSIMRKDTYESASTWDFGFGALYSGSFMDKFGFKPNNSEIQFFTWNGAPVIKAFLPFRALAFDLNPADGVLYAIDAEEDALVAFDASEIIDAFKEAGTIK